MNKKARRKYKEIKAGNMFAIAGAPAQEAFMATNEDNHEKLLMVMKMKRTKILSGIIGDCSYRNQSDPSKTKD